MVIRENKAIGKQAEQLLDDLCFTELPITPQAVCEALSVPEEPLIYREESFQSNAILGMSMRGGILVNSNIRSSGRRNFTGAHEIGHFVLHIQTNKRAEFQCNESDVFGSSKKQDTFEREADLFAASLLMPHQLINPLVRGVDLDWQVIIRVADKCETSLLATSKRLIGIVKEPMALVVHRGKVFWQFDVSPSFPYFIGRPVLPQDVERPQLSMAASASDVGWHTVDALDWVDDSRLPGQKEINYSAIYIPTYDLTMTLLAVDEDEESDDDVWDEPHF